MKRRELREHIFQLLFRVEFNGQEDMQEQVDLFAAQAIPSRDKLERLEKAMDSIRDKYGRKAISIASAVRREETCSREDHRLPPIK